MGEVYSLFELAGELHGEDAVVLAPEQKDSLPFY
jgi:hypothetical protein